MTKKIIYNPVIISLLCIILYKKHGNVHTVVSLKRLQMFYNFTMHECMNGMVSILRFGLAVWIKGLWQTLLLEITVLLWMTSLFWTANNPTDHQVNQILYTKMGYCDGKLQKISTFGRRAFERMQILKFSFRPQLCLLVAVLLKMVYVFGCRGLKKGWTGSAGLVPLKPLTLGLQETTLLGKVTLVSLLNHYTQLACAPKGLNLALKQELCALQSFF